jgi:hypothetical protein
MHTEEAIGIHAEMKTLRDAVDKGGEVGCILPTVPRSKPQRVSIKAVGSTGGSSSASARSKGDVGSTKSSHEDSHGKRRCTRKEVYDEALVTHCQKLRNERGLCWTAVCKIVCCASNKLYYRPKAKAGDAAGLLGERGRLIDRIDLATRRTKGKRTGLPTIEELANQRETVILGLSGEHLGRKWEEFSKAEGKKV